MSEANTDVNTYNADGRIIQVEYAMKAMNRGITTIGVRLSDSVVIVSEKKLISPLQLPKSSSSHYKIYDTILAAVSGINSDAPSIITKCRDICLNHDKLFKEQIGIPVLMEKICGLALKFGEKEFNKKIYSRPFGVSILVAAFQDRPILYNIDPSGSNMEYKAIAIGEAHEVANNLLEEEISKFVDEGSAIREATKILSGVVKDKINENNIEISIVDKAGLKFLSPEQIKTML